VDVDFENVDRARKPIKDDWRKHEGFGLTYLPFIVRAAVAALEKFPQLSATFEESELVISRSLGIGIAVDLDFQGLVVPVIQQAEGKSLQEIARGIQDLAQKAKVKKLSPDDVKMGTFTVTNPGPFGARFTLPVINQPQVAILATDAIALRPIVVTGADGTPEVVIHPVGNLTLAWDHRAFDGAYAASALGEMKAVLETRDWAAELP
jgi:2-oxoglutarate dehydrogenase E2 component (dihydrolipoamide succinyltransferase)